MITIDAKGMVCPIPVVKAKNAIEGLPKEGGTIEILVDNIIACENLAKMCALKGYEYTAEKKSSNSYSVLITVGEGQKNLQSPPQCELTFENENDGGLAVAFSKDKMGQGNDDLGKILIKGFIYSLANLNTPPKTIVFFNSGIKLTLNQSNTIDDLKSLSQKGTQILVCGTCVDFYECKSQVAVGEIANMYNIVQALSTAKSTINI